MFGMFIFVRMILWYRLSGVVSLKFLEESSVMQYSTLLVSSFVHSMWSILLLLMLLLGPEASCVKAGRRSGSLSWYWSGLRYSWRSSMSSMQHSNVVGVFGFFPVSFVGAPRFRWGIRMRPPFVRVSLLSMA